MARDARAAVHEAVDDQQRRADADRVSATLNAGDQRS
jgi:hypothetical protein